MAYEKQGKKSIMTKARLKLQCEEINDNMGRMII
jgi:hypothetical protein